MADDEEEHPLFMTSAPKNSEFDSNSTLGALAALIDGDAEDDENRSSSSSSSSSSGGGKDDDDDDDDDKMETGHNSDPLITNKTSSFHGGRGTGRTKTAGGRGGGRGGGGGGREKLRTERRPAPYSSATRTGARRTRAGLGQAQICLALTTL